MTKSAKQTKKDTKIEKNTKEVEAVVEISVSEDSKIGDMLKSARRKKGLEIEDIANKLNIRRVYLEAIEASNYAEIPDYPYGPGFVRSYAGFLGLNVPRIVQLFKDETDAFKGKDKDYVVLEPQTEVTAPNKNYIVTSLVFILLVYLIWFFFKASHVSDTTNIDDEEIVQTTDSQQEDFPLTVEDFIEANTHPQEDGELSVVDVTPEAVVSSDQVVVNEGSFEDTSKPALATEQAPKPSEEVSSPVSQRDINAPVEIAKEGVFLVVKEEVWVEAKDKEKLYLSKVLKKGDTYAVPNSGKDIILSIGILDSVDIHIDGKLTDINKSKRMNIPLNDYLQ